MEPVETFMEIFTRSWKENNNDALVRILREANGYLRNISKTDGERDLEILLHKETGLLRFIHNVLENCHAANCDVPLKESISVLQLIIDLFRNNYEPYIMQTRDMCILCMKTICWFYARKAAAETLKKLIELYPDYDMQLYKIIDHYNSSYLKLYAKKDGCIFYIVIGTIAKYCPNTLYLEDCIDSIFLQLLKDLKSQFKSNSTKQPEEIKIYMECFCYMFENFIPLENNPNKSEYFEQLYHYVSQLCEPNIAQKVLRNKVFYLLSTYMKHFSIFIYKDYEKWHKLLDKALEESDSTTAVCALRAFYKIIASHLLEENEEDIFLHFKQYLTLNLCNKNLPSKKARLIIFGLGELSVAFEKYAPDEIQDFFQMIALQTVCFYEREEDVDKDCEAIAEYLQTLTKILIHTPKVLSQQINILIELGVFLTKNFPTYKYSNKVFVEETLKATFINITQLDKNLQNEYFSSFFREGILWSCSHESFVDEGLQQENQISEAIRYKNYLPLWHSIFKITDDDKTYRYSILQIFDEFLLILISFIDKLNLNVKICDSDTSDDAFFPLEPENEADFQFFINLVSLNVDIFEKIESFIFENWMERLLLHFIKYSYKHPLIPGFYKLIEVTLKKMDTDSLQVSSDSEMSYNKSIRELISQYLSDVLELVNGFSDDLQLSCIHLIFNAPPVFMLDLIDQTVSIFKISFTIGLEDISLAFFALDTLENWTKCSLKPLSDEFSRNIIHYLEPYISNEDSSVQFFQGIKKFRKRDTKTVINANDEQSLENLQKRILLFYGSLDTSILFDAVYKKALHTNATWSKKDLLQCELFFPDIRLEINFDKFVPRIVEVTKGGDPAMRLAACEFLHAVVTVILGKRLMLQCLNGEVFETLLRIGSDANDSIRALFQPLVIQMSHFLNTRSMKESKLPSEFLDALFEGLTDEYNTPLRDYCGLYLREFTEWSIKQSSEIHSSNVESVIHRITSWSLYPSKRKRRAAAIAFNNLYSILRDNGHVVNRHWLELFYALVKCASYCDDVEVASAVDHSEKVLRLKANLFNARSRERRKPPEFADASLRSALLWLFGQGARSSSRCRGKCRQLFESLLPRITDSESLKGSVASDVNDIVSSNFKREALDVDVDELNNLLSGLEFYSWILRKRIVPFDPASIFSDDSANRFLKAFRAFIVEMNAGSFASADDVLGNAACDITLKILEFLSILLSELESDSSNFLLDDRIFDLITRCTLHPCEIGLTTKRLRIVEKLPDQLSTLLQSMMERLPREQLEKMRKHLIKDAEKSLNDFSEIEDIVAERNNIDELAEFLRGLLNLKTCKFLDFESELKITQEYAKCKITDIFKACKIRILGADSCKKFTDLVKEYLQLLMSFFLVDFEAQTVQELIKLIMNEEQLVRPNGTKVSHGEYFLETLKKPIFRCILRNAKDTFRLLDEFLPMHPGQVLILIEELLIFAQRNKSIECETLCQIVIDRCNQLQRFLNQIEERKARFFNINKIAVSLKKRPIEAIKTNGQTNDFYNWILEELVKTKELERKSMILRSFLICLTDEDSKETSRELALIIRQLRDEDSASCARRFESNEAEKFQAASCFQVLLKMLVATRSLMVYQAVMKFAAGVYKFLYKENVSEYLNMYFNRVSDENAFESLALAYKLFMDLTLSTDRLDVLKYFLLPSVELCNATTIKKFYEQNCQEMAFFVTQSIDTGTTVDRVKAIVTKTGCYSVFEIIFAKFELNFINVTDPASKTEKPVNQLLVQHSLEVRKLNANDEEEREIMRLLHCAALNCCISVISLKGEEKFYKFIFSEDRNKGQLIWEKIVDCEKKYNLSDNMVFIRRDRKKLINVRRRANDDEAEDVRRFTQPMTLTLLEDLHAYDLNDTRILADACRTADQEPERRVGLSLSNDELNEHECMAMLSGVLVELLKDVGKVSELPMSLKVFRNGFATQKDNSKLFLMKLVTNLKDAFLPYVKPMFTAIVSAICSFLDRNELNRIVRDTIVLLIESKCRLTEAPEKKAVQKMLELLIERSFDIQESVYKYNLELLETMCKLWKEDGLTCPIDKLEAKVSNSPELVVTVSLILLRCDVNNGVELANSQFLLAAIKTLLDQNWQDDESKVIRRFELLGYILRLDQRNESRDSYTGWLGKLLFKIDTRNRERCRRCVYALYRGSRGENLGDLQISRFTGDATRIADSHKPDCLELFILRMPDLDPEVSLPGELPRLGLKVILRERVLGCEGPALTIVERLVPLLSKDDVSNFVELVAKNYTSVRCTQPEHRLKSYKILAETYLRHGLANPDVPLSKLCARHLIQGLSDDPDEEIHRELMSFWTSSHFGLPSSCSERLLALLYFYEPELASSFSRFLCLLMLKLTSESLDNDRAMFRSLAEDDPGIKDTSALNSRIFSLNRRKRLLMLGPSLVNRSSQSIISSQTGTRISTVVSWGPTVQPISRREKMAKELGPGSNAAPNYRPNYKFGDYPDVELSHANFVESLRQFVMKDWLSCGHLAVAMICSLVDRARANPQRYVDFLTKLTSNFERILALEQKSRIGQSDETFHFAAVMLEVMIRVQEVRLDANSAAKMSKITGLSSLGILLLEQDMVDNEFKETNGDEPPPVKRPRVNAGDYEKRSWMELADLYKSIGQRDVVKCIISRRGLYSEEFRKAAMQEALNDWASAKKFYCEARESCTDPEKEHCFEAELECLAQLGCWSDINDKTLKAVDGNYDNVWKKAERAKLLPWILEGQLNKTLEDFIGNKESQDRTFVGRFHEWLRAADDDLSKISSLFPQELISILLLCDERSKNYSSARHYLKSSLEHLREKWVRSSPLNENSKTGILTRLRGIYNIHAYMETLRASDLEETTRALIKYWNQRPPVVGQDLYSWNVHVLHRLTFAHLLHERLCSIDEESESSLSRDLMIAGIKQMVAISEIAIEEKNNNVARKNVFRIERTLHELGIDDLPQLNNDFTLLASKYKYVSAQNEAKTSKKCNYYVSAWRIAEDLLKDEELDLSVKIKTKHHVFELTEELKNVARSSTDFLECLAKNDFVLSKLNVRESAQLFGSLTDYSFKVLRSSCDNGSYREIAESYTKFGKYCYGVLHESLEIDSALAREFVSAILNGMSSDSLGSAHYFPCLLKTEYYRDDDETAEIFVEKSKNVPSWLYLPWQAQIISHLTGPLCHLLLPIVQRLVDDYPQALMYNFRSSYETMSQLRENPEIRRLYESLYGGRKIKVLVDEMHRLCQPEYYVRHHLLASMDSGASLNSLLDAVYGENTSRGDLYKAVLDEYRDELERIKSLDADEAKRQITELSNDLYSAMKYRLNRYRKQGLRLKDYSHYLDNFTFEDFEIEVPGQYRDGSKPMPRYHAKVSRFEKSVRIMESKSNPIKIGIVGNDALTYDFLVKFGEDLRQDQRLQQIFRITNRTLECDESCRKRRLRVNTYDVVPLSSSLGLIQWVNDTRSLKEFVEFSMSDGTLVETVSSKYSAWIERAGRSEQLPQMYRDALLKYSSEEVIAKMKELIDHLEWDYLKRTFLALSTSAESFLTLRQNFVTTYATMCIVHWITGVGDRHLENLLIQVKTGKCYGIDFESAFGLGIDQSVPELVPFRLTAQILGLLKPFDEHALFGDTMICVLSALRREKGPTLACLDTFINEPLDWRKHARDARHADRDTGVKWLPNRKMEVVAKKLNGVKPSVIMIEELSNAHAADDEDMEDLHFIRYKLIVGGKNRHLSTVRSRTKDESLTPEEQVQCLLEQAKDLNLLGRMWVGWCPFV